MWGPVLVVERELRTVPMLERASVHRSVALALHLALTTEPQMVRAMVQE